MSATHNQRVFPTQRAHHTLVAAIALLVAAAPCVSAQAPSATASAMNFAAPSFSVKLPDSPGSLISSSRDATDAPAAHADLDAPQPTPPPSPQPPNARTKHSAHLAMTVAPNEIAQPMPVRDKVVGGLGDAVSLFAATGWVVSAGYSQLTNGSPNYGTDKGAFGQRLGAAALRNVSEDILSDCLFAPVLHQDPRYYIMGRGHNFFKRAVYAATRTVISRTDSGRTTPNIALIAGDAAGAAITIPYYPAKNTTFSEVAETFGGSIGGSALGFVVTEFIGDALQYAHLKKKD
ncbi:MAG TPA: hypothetical protein VNY74_13440 [Edaphobacter sp.]|nr:hypothetical protein [Edaphobacter sp.]